MGRLYAQLVEEERKELKRDGALASLKHKFPYLNSALWGCLEHILNAFLARIRTDSSVFEPILDHLLTYLNPLI